jgi:hypothetical protein
MKSPVMVLIFTLFIPLLGSAQSLLEYNSERLKLDQNLMIGLTSWSLSNAAVSSYGWATTDDEAKYFHQMNVMWSGVNLALAIPGYFKARKTDPNSFTFAQTWKEQLKTEKIFLFNTALDLVYMGSGLLLKQRAQLDDVNYYRFRGFGNSLLLQGGFLFLFDLTATFLHTKHRNEKLNRFLEKVEMSDNGLGVKFRLVEKKDLLPASHFN